MALMVEVLNIKGEIITDAKVTLRPGDKQFKSIYIKFDINTATYIAETVPVGTSQIIVKHNYLQGQNREVDIGITDVNELFILGKPGEKTYFR